MARCGTFLFFIVVAVATLVANCVYDASAETTTEYSPPVYDYIEPTQPVCGQNEIWSESGHYVDALCSPARPRYRNNALLTYGRCECPEGFCRNYAEQCVPIEGPFRKELKNLWNYLITMTEQIRELQNEFSALKRQYKKWSH